MFKLFLWNLIGRFLNQFVTLGVSVVLTRLLSPSEFGIIGMAFTFIGFSSIFLDLGFKSTIIQKQEISEKQLSSIFILNLGVGLFLALLFVLFAGFFEHYYEIQGLAKVTQILSLLFVINGFALVPSALLSKKLMFKELTFVNGLSAIISGIIAITMAFLGFGIWSLVAQAIIVALLQVVGYQYFTKWKPSSFFDLSSIKSLWNYSIYMFSASVLDGLYSRLDVIIIGKIFPVAQLGLYTRAQSLDTFVKQYSSGTLVSVFFPYLSKYQADDKKITSEYIYYLHIVSFVSVFLTGLLYLIAKPFFLCLFTETWLESSVFFKIMALSGFVYPVSALMVNILSVRGKSKAFFNLEIIKKVLISFMFLVGFKNGIIPFLYGMAVIYWIILPLNAYFVKNELNIKVFDQLKIIFRYVVIGAIIAFCGELCVGLITNLHLIFQLIILSCYFSIAYFMLNYALKTIGFVSLLEKINLKRYFPK